MIKFFRKIRQNLILKNKTSQYFKYAIGEIVLVVIGILIAIQINTFVSNRQLKENNKVFLKKMLVELDLNKKRMNLLAYADPKNTSDYISLEEAVSNCQMFLKQSSIGFKEIDEEILFKSIDAGGSYLNLHNGVYEELINTGKLYTLGSDQLMTAIKNYYKRCEREDLYNKANTENMKIGYDLLRTNLDRLILERILDSAKFSIKKYPWLFNTSSEKYRNMQQGIAIIMSAQKNNLYKMKEIIKYSDSLIVVINNELND